MKGTEMRRERELWLKSRASQEEAEIKLKLDAMKCMIMLRPKRVEKGPKYRVHLALDTSEVKHQHHREKKQL
jgi:hypothetical protein